MAISRRDFLKGTAILGGSLLLQGHSAREQFQDNRAGGSAGGSADGRSGATPEDVTGNGWTPAYVKLEEAGQFETRVEEAYRHMERCDLCPRQCGVNRLRGERGLCRAPGKVMVYTAQPHYGEEIPLVGRGGSGTIFFSNCNLRCVFCQNWPIAHEGRGQLIEDEELADLMLFLQKIGCHNINVVTPTHVMPHILAATRIAMQKGLRLPLCYNTGGYERVEMIHLLDGIVDIYLPDLKMMDGQESVRYLGTAADYPEHARESIREMHHQVGDMVADAQGIALRGVMVRHLVMPNRIAGTREFVHWVAETLSTDTYVNIMSQYRVEHRAFEYPPIARSITPTEFVEAMTWAEEAGLTNIDRRSRAQLEQFRARSG